jgi:tetrahydromethanopterin S-methyltransferase subunit F
MGLFDQIMSAVANPQQQGSADQLGSILGMAQQVAGNQGLDSGATQAVMSLLGGHVRSSLQNQGNDQAQMMVSQFGGLGNNPSAVNALFPGSMQQQVAESISQRTGLNSGMIMSMLPVLVPLVLNMLKSGAPAQQAQGVQSGNPVLNAFLDADRDGDVDVGDIMGMAGQFLSQRR